MINILGLNSVTFHTTNSTLSLSPLETLHRCIVDHHIISHTPPLPVWIIPIPVWLLWHFITCKNILTLSSALHKSMDSTHFVLHLFSISQYGHAQSTYHMFILLCHTFVSSYHAFLLLFHMLLPIIPHACCPSLPFMFQFFPYISIEYLSCIFPVSNINSVHPSFLTSPQKSILSVQNQGHIGDGWHNTYIEA